ncbi:hypothetical protein X797_007191 [Metarhizium robertsii]|uniref:Vacuolar H+/Ca2+ exchanger n=2 Tax=Metarhizium robertsii TaxID=568076 RepID=E9F4A9_METRA|nr:uncharacterized protein MAA_07108 [Metarhizium robertsii ARSEF 23]EFY97466.1 hypothetical protein MAA_07108 [Metarhizium robertsii ARSEF 23]EXU99724.1 hypothetical protein X797_007191 [Metarhizium robertsii]
MNTEQGKRAESLLLKSSRTYGIQTRKDDVQAAINHPHHGPLFAEWALTHLTSDTLLTADELDVYMALDRNGRVDQLADLQDLSEVPAVTEDELTAAVEELKRCTESISKQTETLRQQQDALARMVKTQAENTTRREQLERVQRKKRELERDQLAKEVERMSQEITLRVTELNQHGPALNDSIATLLQSDDKLLSSLQKLGWELDQPDLGETQDIEKLRETCMRLIKATVETVRTKLDTIYLETLVTAERSGTAKPATNEQVKSLQDEVESLYSEILPVAQMSIDQQYLEPALKTLSMRNSQSIGKTTTSLTYINECLTYLVDRMDRLHAHVKSHKSHQAATAAIAAAAKAEIAAVIPPKKPRQAIPPSPVRTRSNASEVRRRRRSSGAQEESPIETLLQHLAVILPPDCIKPQDQIGFLESVLAERTRKGNDVAKGAQEGFEMAARAHVEDARQAIQLVRDSLLAESPFGDVKLVDPDMDSSISVLAQEVNKAKERLRSLQGQSIVARSEKRDEFIQRWGS